MGRSGDGYRARSTVHDATTSRQALVASRGERAFLSKEPVFAPITVVNFYGLGRPVCEAMKRSPPGDFQIRGQSKRVQPEPLSPTSARGSENGNHVDNIAARTHNSTTDPVSTKDLDRSRSSRSTQSSTHNWSNHASSLTWRRSSTEEAATDRVRRVGYDSMCCDCTVKCAVYWSNNRASLVRLQTFRIFALY